MRRRAGQRDCTCSRGQLDRLAEHERRTRDFTLNSLRARPARGDRLLPGLPHVPDGRARIAPRRATAQSIEAASREARRRNPYIDPSVFEFIRDVLLLEEPPDQTEPSGRIGIRFAMKFQQLTGPVMAKGVEDTAFYIYNRLVSLNEVGGDPASFGSRADDVPPRNAARRRRAWPARDARHSRPTTPSGARTCAPGSASSPSCRASGAAAINRWTRLNRKHRSRVEGAAAPTRNDEYLLYQTLLGAWPLGLDASGRRSFGTASRPTWTRRSTRRRSTRAGSTRTRRTTRQRRSSSRGDPRSDASRASSSTTSRRCDRVSAGSGCSTRSRSSS